MTKRMRPWLLAIISIAVIALLPFIGQTIYGIDALRDATSDAAIIFWTMRVPRVLFAVVIGAVLSAGGLVFQAVFRNDLATPYTLGIASGASFGTLVAIQAGVSGVLLVVPYTACAAFGGAMLSVVLINSLLKVKKEMNLQTVLLAGVSVNFFFSAMILFVQYMMNHADLMTAVRWMMGGIDVYGYSPILVMLPFMLITAGIILYYRRHLDLLSLGDEIALGRGVDIQKTRRILFFALSAAIAAAVSFAGPIGFVGLIVPHVVKMSIGRIHARLVPYVMLTGGAFLAVADTIARTVIAPAEIPVGVITSLLGVPFFIYLLIKKA